MMTGNINTVEDGLQSLRKILASNDSDFSFPRIGKILEEVTKIYGINVDNLYDQTVNYKQMLINGVFSSDPTFKQPKKPKKRLSKKVPLLGQNTASDIFEPIKITFGKSIDIKSTPLMTRESLQIKINYEKFWECSYYDPENYGCPKIVLRSTPQDTFDKYKLFVNSRAMFNEPLEMHFENTNNFEQLENISDSETDESLDLLDMSSFLEVELNEGSNFTHSTPRDKSKPTEQSLPNDKSPLSLRDLEEMSHAFRFAVEQSKNLNEGPGTNETSSVRLSGEGSSNSTLNDSGYQSQVLSQDQGTSQEHGSQLSSSTTWDSGFESQNSSMLSQDQYNQGLTQTVTRTLDTVQSQTLSQTSNEGLSQGIPLGRSEAEPRGPSQGNPMDRIDAETQGPTQGNPLGTVGAETQTALDRENTPIAGPLSMSVNPGGVSALMIILQNQQQKEETNQVTKKKRKRQEDQPKRKEANVKRPRFAIPDLNIPLPRPKTQVVNFDGNAIIFPIKIETSFQNCVSDEVAGSSRGTSQEGNPLAQTTPGPSHLQPGSYVGLPPAVGDISAPVGDISALVGDIPALVGDIPAPVDDIPAPIGGISALVDDIPAPVGNIPTPVGDIPTPVIDIPTPVGDIPTPVGDTPTPVGDFPIPVSDIPEAVNDPLIEIDNPLPLDFDGNREDDESDETGICVDYYRNLVRKWFDDNEREKKIDFCSQFCGQPKKEVSRHFLAILHLANEDEIHIDTKPLSINDVILTKLNKEPTEEFAFTRSST